MTREIVVNGRFLTRRVTGVERYGREILRLIGNRCRVERPRRDWNGAAGHAWEQVVLPARIGPQSILWSPANTGPLAVRSQILTIHDLSPLEHPEWFRCSFSNWYRLFWPMLARHVKKILAPSETVKRKVVARFGVERVIVAPEGVDTSVFHPKARGNTHELPGRYILFLGSLAPRKNLAGLLRAWDAIGREFPDTWLVVAGAEGTVFRTEILPRAERVHYLGYVADADLPALYAGAAAFALPSFDEGFGLPALEAMACGAPVIVSDGGALPEVAGDAALVFPLSEPDGLAQALKACLRDEGLRASLREKGLARVKNYSWQRTANLIWDVLNEA